MLKSLRDGAKSGYLKFILLGFMAMAVGGLVLADVGGFFRGGVSSNLVAKGSGIEISTAEFDRSLRRILARQGMTAQEAYRLGLVQQVLNNEIQTRILTRQAQEFGLQVSDNTVKEQIAKLAEPLAQDGVSKSDALKQVLRQQGISEAEFVSAIRQEMGITLFRNALLGGTNTLSDRQARDLYQYQNENRQFTGFLLEDSGVKDISKPSEDNLRLYYEANKMDFLIAERRDVTIATLKKEMIENQIEITEEELRAAYEENIVAYEKPEQRTLQQAVLATQNDAQEVLNRVEDGKSLKQATKDVTGETTAYLGENDFSESGLLEDIAQPVFDAAKGDIVGPVQTALGFHVMVVKDIVQPQTDSFDKVKKILKDEMMLDRLADDLIDAANALDDQLAGGAPLEEVVSEMGLTTQEYKNFNQAGLNTSNKDVFDQYQGDKAQILEAAFDFNVGEASPVMELEDGRYITVFVDSVEERSFKPYEDVKAQLEKRWMSEQSRLANRARAEDILTKIQEGTSLKDAAKEVGTTLRTYKGLERNGEPKAPITFPALREIFNADKNAVLKLNNPDGFIIGEVTAVSLPDPEKAQKAVDELKEQAADSLPQEILAQYINALGQKYKVEINDRVLQAAYGATETN